MNDRQLDMVLGYLNEGTSIDNTDYMIESINEMVEQSIYESTMIASLLENENNNNKDKSDNKISLGTKIKEAIKRFINWVKTLIAKLRLKMNQIGVKVMGKTIKRDIEKQKEIAKNLDQNATFKINMLEYELLDTGTEFIDIDVEDITFMGNIDSVNVDSLSLNVDSAVEQASKNNIYKSFTTLMKFPTILLYISTPLANFISPNALKRKGISKEKLEAYDKERTISVRDYINFLNDIPALVDNAAKILDLCQKSYNESINEANKLYKEDPEKANNELKICTKIANFVTTLAGASIKAIMIATKLTKKPLKKASKSED